MRDVRHWIVAAAGVTLVAVTTTWSAACRQEKPPAAAAPEVTAAAGRSVAGTGAAPPAPDNPRFSLPTFRVVRSTPTRVVVDLDRPGADASHEDLQWLQVLDETGVRTATRVRVERRCAKTCGDSSPEQCHVEGEYEYSGPPVGRYAVAISADAEIRPGVVVRTPLDAVARQERLRQIAATDAKARIDTCSLAAYGPLAELACPEGRSVYVGPQSIGTPVDSLSKAAVRYTADINSTPVWFVAVGRKAAVEVRIVFRWNGEWRDDVVTDDRGGC